MAMITETGKRLLQDWIYVLVRVERGYQVPFTDRALLEIESHPDNGDSFMAFLHRFLEKLSQGGWRAGSYFPGGWYRQIVERGENPASVSIQCSDLEPFFLEEVVVDGSGRWFVGEKRIKGRVLRFFLRKLQFDPELQRYRIRYPLESHSETRYIHHHSPPLRVIRITGERAGVGLWLNNGQRERLRPETLRLDRREELFCAVQEQNVPAWFEEKPRWELLKDAEEDGDNWVLSFAGQVFPLTLGAPWPYADRVPE